MKIFKKKQRKYLQTLQTLKTAKQKSLEDANKEKTITVEDGLRQVENNLDLLKRSQVSPDLWGAVAELELIENLKSLPNNYYILNDVHISLRKAMLFDDKWRKTAQIDTMVISPAGIFVIEVKNWSKTFIASNDYHDPYDQVKWAAYLCYKQTKIKTRSIIAHTGNIPPKPQGSYAKVLHLNEVKNYILYFDNKAIMDNEEIEDLADYFK